MVLVRLGDREDLTPGRALVDVVRIGRDPVLVDDGRTVGRPGVVDVELAVRREVRVEREAKQPALAAAGDPRADVEEGRPVRAGGEGPDVTGLLDDEEAVGSVAGIRYEDRVVEAGTNLAEGNGDPGRVEGDRGRAGREDADDQCGEKRAGSEPPDQRQPPRMCVRIGASLRRRPPEENPPPDAMLRT